MESLLLTLQPQNKCKNNRLNTADETLILLGALFPLMIVRNPGFLLDFWFSQVGTSDIIAKRD